MLWFVVIFLLADSIFFALSLSASTFAEYGATRDKAKKIAYKCEQKNILIFCKIFFFYAAFQAVGRAVPTVLGVSHLPKKCLEEVLPTTTTAQRTIIFCSLALQARNSSPLKDKKKIRHITQKILGKTPLNPPFGACSLRSQAPNIFLLFLGKLLLNKKYITIFVALLIVFYPLYNEK